MSNRILVTPEQLEQVSAQFAQSGQLSSDMVERLQQSIHEMEGQWQGMTRERFYGDYQQARSIMIQFVESLHKISTELKQISGKFRTTDEMVNGAAMGGTAAVAGILAGTAAAGAVGSAAYAAKTSNVAVKDSNPVLDKAIEGFSAEGSAVSNKENGWYANAINGSASASLHEGAQMSGSIVEAGFDTAYANGSVSLMSAELGASVEDGTLSVGAEGTITKYEGGFKVPLPWSDKSLNIGGSASLGVVGGSAEIGESGVRFHIPIGPGISLFGLGGSVSVK
ncbi:WXG100 family type VII secretion target [Paenibacillus glucanolyticus]